MTLSGIRVRPLTPADDLSAELDLNRRAFGPIGRAAVPDALASAERSCAAGEMFGAFDGPRLIGSARWLPMRQWWRGRSLPMAAVAGVKIAPETRGRGIGRALMTAMLAEIAARRYPVSVLYPATAPLYRSLGFEIAGGRYQTTVPVSSLAALLEPDQPAAGPDAAPAGGLRRAAPADAEAVVATLDSVYAALGACGPATHQAGLVAGWLDDTDHFAYLADDGFLSYRWADGTESIRVDLLAAASASTARAFWQMVYSHGTMADTVRAWLAPDDPVSWLTRESAAVTSRRAHWMLRCLDAPAAVAGRGFPAAVRTRVQFELTDDLIPGNRGCWTLELDGGNGQLTPAARAGTSVLRLSARGFAALYGGVLLSSLRLAGLASGGSAAGDDALDAAFGGRQAYQLHSF